MSYSLPEFLAHAIALESEAAERYQELADMMETNQNEDVAAVFHEMYRLSCQHRDSIRQQIGTTLLPRLRSWQYRWRTPPEMDHADAIDRMTEPRSALTYARVNEVSAMDYYATVSQESDDPEVRRLANAFALEEQEHVEALDRRIGKTR